MVGGATSSNVHGRRMAALVLFFFVAIGSIAAEPGAPPSPQPYRFVVTSEQRGQVAIRGLITVDGKDRVIGHETTPFEFKCESSSMVWGYFEVVDNDDRVRLRIFDTRGRGGRESRVGASAG